MLVIQSEPIAMQPDVEESQNDMPDLIDAVEEDCSAGFLPKFHCVINPIEAK